MAATTRLVNGRTLPISRGECTSFRRWFIGGLGAIAIIVAGAAITTLRVSAAQTADTRERLSAVEASAFDRGGRLDRIERKIDRLLERGGDE